MPSKASFFAVKGSDVEGSVILQRGSMAIENRVGEHVKFGAMPGCPHYHDNIRPTSKVARE